MGFALTEDLGFENGRVRNTNFSKYGMTAAVDMPIDMKAIFVETHEKSGPYGAKGLGEPGHVPQPAAIANAIYNAIGVRLDGIPIAPEKVLAAMRKHKTI